MGGVWKLYRPRLISAKLLVLLWWTTMISSDSCHFRLSYMYFKVDLEWYLKVFPARPTASLSEILWNTPPVLYHTIKHMTEIILFLSGSEIFLVFVRIKPLSKIRKLQTEVLNPGIEIQQVLNFTVVLITLESCYKLSETAINLIGRHLWWTKHAPALGVLCFCSGNKVIRCPISSLPWPRKPTFYRLVLQTTGQIQTTVDTSSVSYTHLTLPTNREV